LNKVCFGKIIGKKRGIYKSKVENSKEKKRLVGVTIGIDLGTTNSCVAVTTGKG